MYFSEEKVKPIGARYEGGKLAKKVHKSVEQLKRHDPDVEVSIEPTEFLLVSNSSVLCGVSLEELEDIFHEIDKNCQFVVFPNKRSYSFVQFSNVDLAIRAKNELHGFVHPKLKTSHQPFVISYVKQYFHIFLTLKQTSKMHSFSTTICAVCVVTTNCGTETAFRVPAEKRNEMFRPADLEIIDDYITEEMENELVNFLTKHPNVKSLKHRAVVHFGHEFDYNTNSAAEWKKAEKVPEIIEKIIEKLQADGYLNEKPDQITANVYEPGHGIPSHYDTHSAFEDPIVSLSLLSDVVMEFKDGANSARLAPILLKRKSLCLIKGESRYRWKHGIVNRKYDVDPRTNRVLTRQTRVSLTLRKIRNEPCKCEWKEFCDWDREGEMGVPNNDELAKKLENSYVSEVYENIASHFDETRHSNWKAVKKSSRRKAAKKKRFIDDLPRGSLIYDVGCGNGKYLIPNDGLIKIGCDMCQNLCEIAHKKGCDVIRSDALSLPFRENSADGAISIAVLHHIATFERRRQMIEELIKMVKKGGRICVTVWSLDQQQSEYAKMRGNKDETRTMINDEPTVSRLKVHDGKEFEQQDVLVPWQIDQSGQTFLRYYHVFREGEAEKLIEAVEGCRLISVEKEQGNYVIIAEKI